MTRKLNDSVARQRDAESALKHAFSKIADETAPPEIDELAEDLDAQLARGANRKSNGVASRAAQSIISSNETFKA